ncbi:unnamed protein product [Heterobilharzia americana]|nr:unnamed protein product [Heterobilharzia americana]
MITKKHLSSTSCRTGSRDRGCAFSCSNLQCTIQEECDRSSLVRTTSVRSSHDFPPNIDEKDLEILGVIGSGSYGRAIKVKHRQLGCLLVLKEVIEQSKEIEETLVREVSLLRNLKHRCILSIIGVVIRSKQFCLITEFIAKGSLHITSFSRDIASGMAYLHKHEVIHRDLTTHNCFVRQDDSVVVADFGLSNDVERNHTPRLRRHHAYNHPRRHTVVGSPFWMAPEMLAGQPYDNSVDVYSFGVIMCQLFTRSDADPDNVPRDGDTMCVDMNALIKLNTFPLNVPPILMSMTTQCVSLDPRKRPCFDSCVGSLEQCSMYLLSGQQSEQIRFLYSPDDAPMSNDNCERDILSDNRQGDSCE